MDTVSMYKYLGIIGLNAKSNRITGVWVVAQFSPTGVRTRGSVEFSFPIVYNVGPRKLRALTKN